MGCRTPDSEILEPTVILPEVPTPTWAIIVEPTETEPPKLTWLTTIELVPKLTIVGRFAELNTEGAVILSVIVSPGSRFSVPPTPVTARLVCPKPTLPIKSLTIFDP